MSNQRYTVKRVGKVEPYLDYNTRCRFAVETFSSITAPPWEQVCELELMLLDREEEL
jgi:hypothetical protein